MPDNDDTQGALYQRVPANRDGRDFIVGDIHGHLERLDRLLEHVEFRPKHDRLFSVGDLIDRGPDSPSCLERLDQPWLYAVRGNHEQMMCDAQRRQPNAEGLWLANGGAWSRALDGTRLARLTERAAGLPWAMEIETRAGERVGLVHADVLGTEWADFTARLAEPAGEHAALWSRDTLGRLAQRRRGGEAGVAGIDVVFHGHTPLRAPRAVANRRWLDTGVFMPDGALTLAELAAGTPLWSSDADGHIRRGVWTD